MHKWPKSREKLIIEYTIPTDKPPMQFLHLKLREPPRKDGRTEIIRRFDMTVSSPHNRKATSTKSQQYSYLYKTSPEKILTDEATHEGKPHKSTSLHDNGVQSQVGNTKHIYIRNTGLR